MIMRLLAGIGIPIVMGILFCLSGSEDTPPPPPPFERVVKTGVARVLHLSVEQSASIPRHTETARRAAPRETGVLSLPVPATTETYSAMVPARNETARAFNDVRLPAREKRQGVFSNSAWASLSESSCPQPAGSNLSGGSYVYPSEVPDKGISLWAGGGVFKGRQKERDSGSQFGFYDYSGQRGQVGFKRDWSIDTVLGMSLDAFDSEFKGLADTDGRKNDISGYVVNAHFSTMVFERFYRELLQVDGNILYGRMQNKGSGEYRSLPWREDKHDSTLYGASLKVGSAFVNNQGILLEPEIGLEYARLNSKQYTVDWDNDRFTAAKQDSTSLAVPMRVAVSTDCRRTWGLIRPRIQLGCIVELDDSAGAFRALNASSAGMATPVIANHTVTMQYDKSQKMFYEFGLGMDVRTNGGWSLRADYQRLWAEQFHNDLFKLELMRCF